ncbi:MAG: hypothetical protein IPM32_18705 [Ignavibacteriae bacterium]|nr:hypothetical protein [Ignavibacteriota bacterium]
MSLFQKSVIKKYLSNLDSKEVTSAYNKFREFYGDSERIENIKLLKEENYQEGFFTGNIRSSFGIYDKSR